MSVFYIMDVKHTFKKFDIIKLISVMVPEQ